MQTKYDMRRANMTRAQSYMVRKMLDGHLAALKNHVVSAVNCGDEQYGTTGLTGYAYARCLVKELNEYMELCQIFPPDDMWQA